MGIFEPLSAQYSKYWFTMPQKNGILNFIQELQLINTMTIYNVGIGLLEDEFAIKFNRRLIYFIGDLCLGYYQFHMALESRDITMKQTHVGLVSMSILLEGILDPPMKSLSTQGPANVVAHIMNTCTRCLEEQYMYAVLGQHSHQVLLGGREQ